ncbi:MAG: FixH family protein [Phycisphaerales bacterium]|nr:MAG: FixH family protein [Phycisphaerales bacterium]
MKAKITWIGIIVGLLGMSVVIYGIAIVITVTDPSFAIEPDYEKKAADWDTIQRQQAINRALAWSATINVEAGPKRGEIIVRVTLHDRDDAPIDGAIVELDAFHNARASQIYRARLDHAGEGQYTAAMPIRRSGIWEFRLTANHRGDVFTKTIRKTLKVTVGR